MVIKNLTDKPAILDVRSLTSKEKFTVIIQPYGFTDLDPMLIVTNKDYLKGSVEFGGCEVPTEPEKQVAESTPIVDEVKEEKEPEVAPDKFICDICGAEFASARGLQSHKNKSHPEK